MAARKRLSLENKAPPNTAAAAPEPKSTTNAPLPDPPLSPPKQGAILKISLFFLIPYFYLVMRHYEIDAELKESILINAGLSLFGYFVTVRLIPVASRYVLRRNLFGYDINKNDTPQGSVKV